MAAIKVDAKELRSERFRRLRAVSGWDLPTAVGIVGIFWADTRANGVEQSDAAHLATYIPCPDALEGGAFAALCQAGYLKPMGDTQWFIVDNAEAKAKLAARREQAKVAGSASVAKRKKKVRKKVTETPKALTAVPPPDHPVVADEGSVFKMGCMATWQAYAAAYQRQTGQLPTRNAKTNSLIVQLVQRLGIIEAPKVAAFYCGHPSSYYTNRVWSLDALVKDAEALRTQWAAKTTITPQAAQQASAQAHYEARRARLADDGV